MSFLNSIPKQIILNINETNRKIENAFDYLFDIWLFWESDNGSYRNEQNLNKQYKSLILCTSLKDFLKYDYEYCGTQKGLKLTQIDFIESFIIDLEKMDFTKENTVYRAKYQTFLNYLNLRKEKYYLDLKTKQENSLNQNEKQKFLLQKKLQVVQYFKVTEQTNSDPENPKTITEIDLFVGGNREYIKSALKDLKQLQESNIYTTLDSNQFFHFDSAKKRNNIEAFKELLNAKYNKYKQNEDPKADFVKYIDYEIEFVKKEFFNDEQIIKKWFPQLKDWIDFLEKQKDKSNNLSNQSKEEEEEIYNLQIKLESNLQIFITDNEKDLFCFLAEKFAKEKRVVEYSNIYRWMLENHFIRHSSGVKFMKMITENNLTTSKYTRIDDFNETLRGTFNQLKKEFNQLKINGVKFE